MDDVETALARLLTIARSDAGQSRRVRDFLFAWWNGSDLGHFPIEHLWNVESSISADMLTIMAYLARQPSAGYADAFGYETEIGELIEKWKTGVPS